MCVAEQLGLQFPTSPEDRSAMRRQMWQLTIVMLIVAASSVVALAWHARPKTMLHNHFDSDAARKLEQIVTTPNCLWVTDADGTLWRDDIGEGFLKQLIADGALVSPEAKGVDVWASYEARVAKDKLTGYAWAVQVMEGMREEDVVRRADAFAKSFVPAHLHPEMAALLEAARAHKCQVSGGKECGSTAGQSPRFAVDHRGSPSWLRCVRKKARIRRRASWAEGS